MGHKRVAILISGGGSNMLKLLDDMMGDHPARAVLVMSNDPEAAGLARAADRGIATASVDHRPFAGDRSAFEAELLAHLSNFAPDVVCLAGFMRVLTADFVAQFEGRMLNIHPSLLPKYKGLHTHARAIEAGDETAGCTVHEVTAALDDGPIWGQARVPILSGDTPESLAARVLVQEHILYPKVLRRFVSGQAGRVELDTTG